MRPKADETSYVKQGTFQSSPGSVAGCDGARYLYRRDRRLQVSILTRLGGRVRRGVDTIRIYRYRRFQSSPGSVAGCDPKGSLAARYLYVFQSSPGSVAGCDACRPPAPSPPPREFQSSPGSVAGCDTERLGYSRTRGVFVFQSSPGSVAGCDRSAVRWRSTGSGSFNPHPARWPGATAELPEYLASDALFQSSPGSVAGCDRTAKPPPPQSPSCFNPHPARWPGATLVGGGPVQAVAGFNPHPARWPGATKAAPSASVISRVFQSSPGSVAGCDANKLGATVFEIGFNPHPARWPGATCCGVG